jgi:hypothetical protein
LKLKEAVEVAKRMYPDCRWVAADSGCIFAYQGKPKIGILEFTWKPTSGQTHYIGNYTGKKPARRAIRKVK